MRNTWLFVGMGRRLTEVSKGVGLAGGGGVAVLNSSHVQQLLGHSGSDDASSAGSGNQTHENGAACSGHLDGDGVRVANLQWELVRSEQGVKEQ